MYTVSFLLLKALLVFELHQLQGLRNAKPNPAMRVSLAGEQQLSLRH
jgi:hypothetical protein